MSNKIIMIQGFRTKKYGHVTIKNISTGIEIVTEDCDVIEISKHYDLDVLSIEDVEKLIESTKEEHYEI